LQYNKLELFLSKPRLDRFLQACGGSESKALELYKSNLYLAQAFYPVLNLFEIILRNTINRTLIDHFQDSDWIITQKNGIMADKSLKPSFYFLKKSISKAEKKLIKKKVRVTASKIIAEQSFGFWTSLFEPHHYRLLKGSIIHCFPLKPVSENRSSIAISLRNIRDFRNRVYHNEPICFNSNSINLDHAEQIHKEIYKLLDWIDSELSGFVKYHDQIQKKIISAKRI